MTAVIRLARPADGAAIAAIYRPIVERTAISFEATPPDAAEMARRIADVLIAYPWLVCERGGVVTGYAYGSRHRAREAYRWAVETTVYVAQEQRRAGVGRGLYVALLGLLAAQGYANAYAGIALPNPGSVALHDAMGFTPIGIFRAVGYKHGRWHDVGWWQRPVGDAAGEPRDPQTLEAIQETAAWSSSLAAGAAVVRS